MSYEKLIEILDSLGIEYAYYEFKEPPKSDAYIAYYEDDPSQYGADDRVYHSEDNFIIELYSKKKNRKLEKKLTEAFDENEIYWTKAGQQKLDSEGMFLSVFYV